MNFSIQNNELFTGNGERVQFLFPVAEFIEFEDVTIVRLNVPIDKILNENVFGVSKNGVVLWQISKRKYIYENSPYMNLSKSNKHVKAHNWDCIDLVLDPNTGDVIEKLQSK
jgi:hypothetical protein